MPPTLRESVLALSKEPGSSVGHLQYRSYSWLLHAHHCVPNDFPSTDRRPVWTRKGPHTKPDSSGEACLVGGAYPLGNLK